MKGELATLIGMCTHWLLALLVATLIIFSTAFTQFTWYGYTLWLPWLSDTSLAASVFLHLATVLTPDGVDLVVLSPMAAFAAQVLVAFWMAFLLTLPFGVWRLLRYLAPALRPSEMRALYYVCGSVSVLLAAGVYFSYAVISPYTISILYTFTAPLGVTPLLGVSELISTFMALTLTTALMFTVPVGMVLLTWLGLLSARWWRDHARYAIVGFLAVSAIITPDGTGVSMVLLTAPVTVLYGIGIIVSTRVERQGTLFT